MIQLTLIVHFFYFFFKGGSNASAFLQFDKSVDL